MDLRSWLCPLLSLSFVSACDTKDVSPPEPSGATSTSGAPDDTDGPPVTTSEGASGATDGGGTTAEVEPSTASDDSSTGAPEPWPEETDTGYWDEEECDDVAPPKQLAPEDINELCDIHGEHRSCGTVDEEKGTQFCDLETLGGWGECLSGYACIPGDYELCFLCDPDFGTVISPCELYDGYPSMDSEACDTPLVIRLDGGPVEFAASTSRFVMSAADGCAATDWPTAATPWLAIDLDRSGSIDGGHELFGSGTALGPTRASDGFVALAALDSDGDSLITPADARWGELLLWFDHDADRRSTLWELEPLASRVTEIGLQYAVDRSRCDARGNCEIERAPARLVDGAAVEVVDVRLACQ